MLVVILKKDLGKELTAKTLWEMVQQNNEIHHNSQMDVVLALWSINLIE